MILDPQLRQYLSLVNLTVEVTRTPIVIVALELGKIHIPTLLDFVVQHRVSLLSIPTLVTDQHHVINEAEHFWHVHLYSHIREPCITWSSPCSCFEPLTSLHNTFNIGSHWYSIEMFSCCQLIFFMQLIILTAQTKSDRSMATPEGRSHPSDLDRTGKSGANETPRGQT